MNVLTGSNQRGSKLFKVTINPTPAVTHHEWPSLDTYEPSQNSYSLLVPLDRLLSEMTQIKNKGGRIVEIVAADVAATTDQSTVVFESAARPVVTTLWSKASEQDVQAVITAAYKQVFGNTYVLESERLVSAESLLRNRSISVRDFVRFLAKSDLYKERFFSCTSNNRFIELNFKHLLGRAPYNQSEIVEHLDRYQAQGYEAEIDSYIDSDEYSAAFGDTIVPYYRGFKSQNGQTIAGFERMFRLYRGDAGSDTNLNQTGQVRRVDPKKLLRSGRGIV
ncbi:phycobilisome rod-core linker polypeptide [Gloeobacter kilaueensis]|uniref:Phycobilisome linker polypeptide n=1 Tax=Gloeobacter kilaueensis (strain ATCC BAA-2537 / CCAP 1431/1 / ULC 316 / JS1) TaxID=1183438 RepID=U5QFW1_GLOK1|nr:phycobilisome rod-core linker polypeptide [Gloeobacter kilaueensis]AGY57827.1 phycobilisome linker polypeptide [Gloeobacter kilaueensis JS1]